MAEKLWGVRYLVRMGDGKYRFEVGAWNDSEEARYEGKDGKTHLATEETLPLIEFETLEEAAALVPSSRALRSHLDTCELEDEEEARRFWELVPA